MNNVVRIGLFLVVHEPGWILIVLDKPALPDILYCLLISRRSYDTERMEIHSCFDHIGDVCGFAVTDCSVSLQEDGLHQVIHAFFIFDPIYVSHCYENAAEILVACTYSLFAITSAATARTL